METHEIKREKFPAAHQYVSRLSLMDLYLLHLESHANILLFKFLPPFAGRRRTITNRCWFDGLVSNSFLLT